MDKLEQNQTPEQIEAERLQYQDEPFYYEEGEQNKPFPPHFWLQWGLLLVVGFYFISIFLGGFGGMHRYGVQGETGINYIFLITQTEKIFFAALLLCLPAAVFLALFAERFWRPSHLEKAANLLEPKRALRIVLILMLLVGLVVTGTILNVIKQTPISDDENVYTFQTRILATGHLTIDSKPGDDALFEDNIFLVNNGKIFGQYPFGHSFVLLAGHLLGFANLSQILFAMFVVLGAYLVGRELYGVRAGLITAVLIALSPSFLFTSSTLLAHTDTLFFLTWFAYFAVKTVKDDRWLYPVLCGLCFGGAFHIRGASTLMVGMPAALVLAFLMLRAPGKNLKKIVLLGISVGVAVGLFLVLNAHVNGDLFKTNYHAAWIGKTQFDSPFGFGKGAWRIIHTPTQGLLNAVNNLVRLNAWLFGWPIGFLFVFVWAWQKGRKAIDFLMLAPPVLCFAGYFFYFWPGISDTGPVLYFELLLPLALLSARGIEKTPDLLERYMGRELAIRRTVLFVGMTIFLALITFHFYNAKALAKIPNAHRDNYKHVAVPPREKAVVFTDYYFRETGQQCWVAGRVNRHEDLGDDVLYVLDYGRDKNQAFLDTYYPDRKGYVLHFKYGIADFKPLSEYTAVNYLKNYPDSR